MIVREILPEEKKEFSLLTHHPLQAWEWGEFRAKTGKKVFRLGVFDPKTEAKKLKAVYQLTVHPISQTNYSILYFPRGPMPDKTMIQALKKVGQEQKAVLIKMDPDVSVPVKKEINVSAHEKIHDFLVKNDCQKARPFWFEYTYQIDLGESEDELLAKMHPKTRYNLRLSQHHGVTVEEDNSEKAFKAYLDLMAQTTKRQGFWAHTPEYHRKLWQTIGGSQNQDLKARLLLAKYKGKVLVAWMFFVFKKTLYYPYGASLREHREVMPAYTMMWEAIKFGQKLGCQTFDLWGCLGPKPDPKDPWFGFHRFKSGFGGQMVKFLGSYDLIIDHRLYSLYNLADTVRWQLLKLKAKLPF